MQSGTLLFDKLFVRGVTYTDFSAIASCVTAGVTFEADRPNPTPCLADCTWAVPCKHCDSCFQNPANWVHPTDECKGTEFDLK